MSLLRERGGGGRFAHSSHSTHSGGMGYCLIVSSPTVYYVPDQKAAMSDQKAAKIQQQREDLLECFPQIDKSLIHTLFSENRHNVDKTFFALLALSEDKKARIPGGG